MSLSRRMNSKYNQVRNCIIILMLFFFIVGASGQEFVKVGYKLFRKDMILSVDKYDEAVGRPAINVVLVIGKTVIPNNLVWFLTVKERDNELNLVMIRLRKNV